MPPERDDAPFAGVPVEFEFLQWEFFKIADQFRFLLGEDQFFFILKAVGRQVRVHGPSHRSEPMQVPYRPGDLKLQRLVNVRLWPDGNGG